MQGFNPIENQYFTKLMNLIYFFSNLIFPLLLILIIIYKFKRRSFLLILIRIEFPVVTNLLLNLLSIHIMN